MLMVMIKMKIFYKRRQNLNIFIKNVNEDKCKNWKSKIMLYYILSKIIFYVYIFYFIKLYLLYLYPGPECNIWLWREICK